jgi:hypothetical protein
MAVSKSPAGSRSPTHTAVMDDSAMSVKGAKVKNVHGLHVKIPGELHLAARVYAVKHGLTVREVTVMALEALVLPKKK